MTEAFSRFHIANRPATRRAALAAAGLAGLSLASRPAAAQQTDNERDADLDILNYLLGLEHLEAALMESGLSDFNDIDWTGAAGGGQQTRLDLETIRDQEQAHVAALRNAIEAAGGVPVEPIPYQFGYRGAHGFIRVAAGIAQTITGAYGGAIPLLADPSLQVLAIGIHSVEGRHAAWMKQRAGESPFPDPIDQPLTRDEATANLAGYTGAEAAPPQVTEVPPETPPPAETVVVVVTATPEALAVETPAPIEPAVSTVPPDARNVFAAVIADAAARLDLPEETVEIVSVDPQTWSDASLDCPKPGEVAAQVLTDGYRVVVAIGGQTLEYHTDLDDRFVLCDLD
jgi:hypothetical protein